MSIAESLATYLVRVIATTIVQLFTLFGPGLILVALTSILARYVTKLAYVVIGRYFYLLLFGWLGTAIHEIGHAIFMLIFGYQVIGLELFKPNVQRGSLGTTSYVPDRNSLFKVIGLFFIGIAPILFGTMIIFVALFILFQADMVNLIERISVLADDIGPQSGVGALFVQTLAYCAAILGFIFDPAHLSDWRLYLFLYLTFAIGSSIHLSKSDIAAATEGFIALIILILLINLVTLWQVSLAAGSFELLSRSYAFFYVILALALALNALAALIMVLPALVLARR